MNLDLETYSELPLDKVGVYAYAMHPSTRIELAAWAAPGEEVAQWDYNDGPVEGSALWAHLHDESLIWDAFNAQFERVILQHVWGIEIPAARWRCTMQRAWAQSFSGGLGQVGDQLGLAPDKKKLADGRKLVMKFCKPAPASHKADRYTKDNTPGDWERYRQYNVQDVVAEIEIGMLVPALPDWEQQLWVMDQHINARGVPVDRALINRCVELERTEKARLKKQMNDLTGLDNANSTQQLIPWLQEQGVRVPLKFSKAKECSVPTIDKDAVRDILQASCSALVGNTLELRQKVSLTSTKKWAAFQKCICPDDRVRGMFQFGGAQRTQRWAGRLVQLHNLKQGYPDADKVADILIHAAREFIAMITGDVLEALANTVRTAITAPEGEVLVVCDLSAIESRVLGHVSGCTAINTIFAEGRDTYKAFAAEYYRVAESAVTAVQRKFSKPPVLGCGYQLGADGLITYAEGYGVDLHKDESQRLVDLYRSIYPEVPEMWYWLLNACKAVTRNRAEVYTGCEVRIHGDDRFLYIDLPSGRRLHYFQPTIEYRVPPWGGDARPTLTYMGMDQYTHKWTRISTHGGKLTENIVQAIARDILAAHMEVLHMYGFDLVGHVHDEAIVQSRVSQAEGTLDYMKELMSWTPDWAPGLLLSAGGFITRRYRKE